MGVLKARVGGVWVPVSFGEPIPVRVQSGTWTPTLTGIAIGTGGTPLNIAAYTYVGGPNIGDRGIMSARGQVRFGTTGVTLPAGIAIDLTLPTGFQFPADLTNDLANFADYAIGTITCRDDGAGSYPGWLCLTGTANKFRPIVDQTTITTHTGTVTVFSTRTVLAATAPFPWGINDAFAWAWTAPVVRA